MTKVPYARPPAVPEPKNPLAMAFVAVFSCMVFLISIVSVAAFVVRDELRAEPVKLSWTFFVIVFCGASLYTVVQFAILYSVKPKEFWPQGPKQWLQRLSPIATLLPAPFVLLLFTPMDPVMGLGGFAVMLSVVAMVVPVLLLLGDCFQNNKSRVEETIKLHAVERTELPRGVRSYFEAHTDELNRLGFEQLGDYRLKERSPTYARFFLNRDSDTFAEICHSRFMVIPLRAVCFFSLTPAGQYLESSNMRVGKRRQTQYFELLLLPHVVTRDVFQQHQARLRELDQDQSRRFAAADLEPVIHYGQKHLYELMVADGLVSENPYADFDESVLVQQAVARSDVGRVSDPGLEPVST